MEYTTKIIESSRELSAKERIGLKDVETCKTLDNVIKDNEKLRIKPVDYVVLEVHNEFANDNKDYNKFIIIDENGDRYITGSNTFFNTFLNIYNEITTETTDFEIDIYKKPSKKYNGKSFLTCSIVF